MRRENMKKSWRPLFIIICLLYMVGIILGFSGTINFQPFSLKHFQEISNHNFNDTFLYFAKISFPLAIVGIFAIGVFFVFPWVVACGYFYGTIAKEMVYVGNTMGFISNSIVFLFFTISIIIFSSSLTNLSLSKYKNYRNPKAYLPRELKQNITEHAILCTIGSFFIIVTSFFKVLLK